MYNVYSVYRIQLFQVLYLLLLYCVLISTMLLAASFFVPPFISSFFHKKYFILNLLCSLFVSINNSQRQRPHNQPQIINLSERMSLECIAKHYVPTKRGMILGRTKNTLHERLIAKLGVQSSIGLLFKSI